MVLVVLHCQLLDRSAFFHLVYQPKPSVYQGRSGIGITKMRAGQSNQGMKVTFILFKARQSTSDNDSTHRVSQEADFRYLRIFSELVVDLVCQSSTHLVYVPLSSRLVWRRNIQFYFVIIVASQLDLDFFHIKPTGSESVDHNNQYLFDWLAFLRFFFCFCELLKKDRSFCSKKSLIDDGESMTKHIFLITEELFILISQLIGKLNSHLFFISIHIYKATSLESNYRLAYFLLYHFLILETLYTEKLVPLLFEDHTNDLPPNLIDLLGILVQQLFVQMYFL